MSNQRAALLFNEAGEYTTMTFANTIRCLMDEYIFNTFLQLLFTVTVIHAEWLISRPGTLKIHWPLNGIL